MKLHGQRWVYRIGNSIVKADNAFSWAMWGHERLIVNDEPAHMTGSFLGLRRRFKEDWMTMLGDETLHIDLRARGIGIASTAMLSGETIAPVATLEATWRGGRHSWPAEDAWLPARRRGWIVAPLPVEG